MFLLIIGLLFVNFDFIHGGEFDLTIEVEPGKLQCFFQPVKPKHKTIEVDYQVLFCIIYKLFCY